MCFVAVLVGLAACSRMRNTETTPSARFRSTPARTPDERSRSPGMPAERRWTPTVYASASEVLPVPTAGDDHCDVRLDATVLPP